MRPRKLLLIFFPSLIFLLVASFHRHVTRDFSHSPPLPLTASLPQLKYARALSEGLRPALKSAHAESVLFPDWEVFVLLPPNLTPAAGNLTAFVCLFHNNATSAAKYSGRLPSSNRHAFSCEMPASVQRLRPFYTPRLIGPDSDPMIRSVEMIRYERFAYDSLSTAADVIVFAKGVNKNQGKDRPASDVTCVFTVSGAVYAVTNATVSAQEVFRCPHPSLENILLLASDDDARVSIRIAGEKLPIPSLAAYHPPAHDSGTNEKSLTCACTMVRNAGKFVHEWVAYHSAIGIERFFLYDNGSEDGLESVLRQLNEEEEEEEGYDVSSVYWPWPKTQEAGFSHCVAARQNSCTWMAFIDVDEFIYSPSWTRRTEPEKSMVRSSFLPPEPNRVGQVQLGCVDFGPSGIKSHPKQGVTQGYTCRWSPPKNNNSSSNKKKKRSDSSNMVRHKSIVRLEAVSESLKTVVHHFEVGSGWEVRKMGMREGVVNHYKYQAWSEFRNKFRRRVSTFVADWREERNLGSKDRTPGLGREAVKPDWWDRKECDGSDTRLRDLVRKWFLQPSGEFAWEQ